MKKIVVFLIAGMSILFGSTNFPIVTHEEVLELQKQNNTLLIDARPPKLYKLGTIMGAMNINMRDMKVYENKLGLLPNDKSAKIVSFCNGPKCKLSHKLAKSLKIAGYTNVVIYQGGYPEWRKKKLEAMGMLRECKNQSGEYQPSQENKIDINGITLYKGAETGMVDQRWFAKKLNTNSKPEGITLVDVRSEKDFNAGHYEGAINIPYNVDKGTLDATKLPKSKAIVIYCHTGMMSVGAWQSLQKNKVYMSNIFYLDANFDCTKGKCSVEPNEDL
ncbi:rhodanese-like domain-containing protein [Sulfurovum sp. XGS-02]|uniref:rhodanese-like domain-containing protein n=1 Tax=Sulfurovum sp. XGS-02 TaxID=2925411 RepID=UPI00206B3F7E|nr:rhodanese-like domain-containing protein [Sulfurovum sp. XGS-02]UPT76938.1 rhodanese-like domain-containing protein [Sulfurovum sp. XGS-02]